MRIAKQAFRRGGDHVGLQRLTQFRLALAALLLGQPRNGEVTLLDLRLRTRIRAPEDSLLLAVPVPVEAPLEHSLAAGRKRLRQPARQRLVGLHDDARLLAEEVVLGRALLFVPPVVAFLIVKLVRPEDAVPFLQVLHQILHRHAFVLRFGIVLGSSSPAAFAAETIVLLLLELDEFPVAALLRARVAEEAAPRIGVLVSQQRHGSQSASRSEIIGLDLVLVLPLDNRARQALFGFNGSAGGDVHGPAADPRAGLYQFCLLRIPLFIDLRRNHAPLDGHARRLHLVAAGSASEREASPLSVSLNGLQFSSSLPFVYNRETALEAGAGAESGGAGAVSW